MSRKRNDTEILLCLLSRVQENEAGHWIWQAGTNNRGYPSMQIGRWHLPYRALYELMVGPIPDGYELDHLCRIPLCCNPAHLEPVTPLENTRRGLRSRNVQLRPTVVLADDDPRHGHANTYHNAPFCRCDRCRDAAATYRRECRARRKAAS